MHSARKKKKILAPLLLSGIYLLVWHLYTDQLLKTISHFWKQFLNGLQDRAGYTAGYFCHEKRKAISYFWFIINIQPTKHQEDKTALLLQEKALMDLGKNPSPYKGCEHFPT